MKYIKKYESNKFKVGEYAIMLAANNKRVEILEVTPGNLKIDYDGQPMDFLMKGFMTELEYNTKKFNI